MQYTETNNKEEHILYSFILRLWQKYSWFVYLMSTDVDQEPEEELGKLVLLLDFPFLLWDAKPRLYIYMPNALYFSFLFPVQD